MFKNELFIICNNIKNEIKNINNEILLEKFFHFNFKQHKNFLNTLSYILAYQLSNYYINAITLYKIIKNIYKKNIYLIERAILDLYAIKIRNPIFNLYYNILVFCKGFISLQAYRIINYMWLHNNKTLSLFLYNHINNTLSIDIHPGASIGYGVMLDHATGIVIGETTKIENFVSIFHSVTLGSTGKKNIGPRHPIIKEGVILGAGSIILGNIIIGKYSKIGAGSIILNNIPPYTTAINIPAHIL